MLLKINRSPEYVLFTTIEQYILIHMLKKIKNMKLSFVSKIILKCELKTQKYLVVCYPYSLLFEFLFPLFKKHGIQGSLTSEINVASHELK